MQIKKTLENTHLAVLWLLIFSPKIVISSIPGLSSAMRIDVILALIYSAIFLLKIILKKDCQKNKLLYVLFLFFGACAYVFNSKDYIVAVGQFLLYISLVGAFAHGASFVDKENWNVRRIIFSLLKLNIIIHILFYFLDIGTYSGAYVNDAGLEENYYIFGLYGISSMPFQFAVYVAAFVFILMHGGLGNRKSFVLWSLIACVAMLTGDSRISLVALILAVFGFWTILISPLLLFISNFFQTKSISVFSNYGAISADPSLGMRLLNIENYLDWLSLKKFVLGGGAQSFLEFSEQYGFPGPLDMGYVRMVSEFGVIGFVFAMITSMWFVKKRFSIKHKGLMSALIFCAVYSVLNEGLLATRSGHLMIFVLGLLYFKPVSARMTSSK